MSSKSILNYGVAIIVAIVLVTWYVGHRTTRLLELGIRARRLVWATLGLMMGLQVAVRFLPFMGGKDLAPGVRMAIHWGSAVSSATLVSLFLAVLLLDFGAVILKYYRYGAADEVHPSDRESPASPERRALLARGGKLATFGLTGSVLGTGVGEAVRVPRVVDVMVPIAGLAPALENFHIVQISDLHVGPTIGESFVRDLVTAINALNPDLIAITGDLADGLVNDLWADVAPLADLRARHGVFYVTGNHEYYWDAPGWCEAVTRLGATVLSNEHRVLHHEGSTLLLAGVTDYGAGGFDAASHSDPRLAVAGAPDCDARILLAHQPRSCRKAAGLGFHLQLSGHTHGGQILPWAALILLVQPFVAGLNRAGDLWVYVSRGAGYWGPPLRLGAPSEIASIRLRRGEP